VIVPAFNEGPVIDRCLDGISSIEPLVVVVAANGCQDDSAARARSHGVTVIELARASKIGALNAAEVEAGDCFPRIYLDADADISADSLCKIIDCLSASATPRVVSPRINFELKDSSWPVRAFYRTYLRLPYLAAGLIGGGCIGVNSAGRSRWAEFPDVTADDLFIQGQFAHDERIVLTKATCTTYAPRTLAALLAVRTRTYFGNRELATLGLSGLAGDTTRESLKAIARLVRHEPLRCLDACIYVAVNLCAKYRAGRRTPADPWLRDGTTR
jgi:glycosyltransferase involved in cell wall biosynthesis